VLERLRAADGALFVRVRYRTQSLSQIRSAATLTAASPPSAPILPIAGCEARDQGLVPARSVPEADRGTIRERFASRARKARRANRLRYLVV
jgi:hypothetical protein